MIMARLKRRITRELGTQRYHKIFFLSVEGAKTETRYFALYKQFNSIININCIKKGNKSSPQSVLKQMIKYLKDNDIRETDEAWLVVDVDKWQEDDLQKLYEWSKKKKNYGLAVSNPKFEYWLLLHFEDGKKAISANICKERLKKYAPDYEDNIDAKKFNQESINEAVNRARQQDTPPCNDWPRRKGTTVYRLVEKILSK